MSAQHISKKSIFNMGLPRPNVKNNYHVPVGISLVAFLYLFFVSTSAAGEILYWLISPFFAAYAKFFIYPVLVVIFYDLIVNTRVVKSRFIIFVGILFCIGLLNGILSNKIDKAFAAHFLPFILPVFAYSYGFRCEFAYKSFTDYVDKYSIRSGYLLCFFVLIYFLLFKIGYVQYFGAGVLFAYPLFYALCKGLYFHAAVFYSFNIITGKRSVFAALTIVVLLYIFLKLSAVRRIIFLSIVGVIFTILLVVGMQSDGQVFGDSFDRYFTIFRYLSEQDDVFFAIDLATSGRLFDAVAVIEVLGDNVFRWIFGMGFGATYDIYYSFADEVHTTHYSHVAPLSYIFLGGILLAFAAFGKVLYEGAHALNHYDNHLSLMMFYFLIMSVSGANLFTDVFWWIIIGAFTARRLQNRY
jgi:hypothetical protein